MSAQQRFNGAIKNQLSWHHALGSTVQFNDVEFIGLSGDASGSAEASEQSTIAQKCRLKKILAKISTNSLDGSATIQARRNGASVGPILTVGAGVTGVLELALDVEYIKGQDLAIIITGGGTTGAMSFNLTIGVQFIEE